MPVVRLTRGVAQIIAAKSPRALTPPADDLHGVVPAVGISASSMPPPSQVIFTTKGVRAHNDAPLDHGPSSALGTRTPSAVTPCRGSTSTMEARAANAAPLNHGTGACTSHAPPRHASRSKKAAATTRRPHTRAGSSPLLRGREAAVGLRCWKANPNTPRSFTRFDPVSPRDRIGRSIIFLIKEEPTSLATSSLYSKRANGNEPPRARNIFPIARAPLSNTPTGSTGPAPSLGTLTHVHPAMSAPVAQD